LVRGCKKRHGRDCADYDIMNWTRIHELKLYLCKDTVERKCLLTRIRQAIKEERHGDASAMQLEMQAKEEQLQALYSEYRKNLL
jgi:glutamine synthetase